MIPDKLKERLCAHFNVQNATFPDIKIAIYERFIIIMKKSLQFHVYIQSNFKEALTETKRRHPDTVELTLLKNHDNNDAVLYSDLVNNSVGKVQTEEDIIIHLLMNGYGAQSTSD